MLLQTCAHFQTSQFEQNGNCFFWKQYFTNVFIGHIFKKWVTAVSILGWGRGLVLLLFKAFVEKNENFLNLSSTNILVCW